MTIRKTPNYYYIDKEINLTVDKVLNNFAGGLNFWKSSAFKYAVRAFDKHSNPINCLNKCLNCVFLEQARHKEDVELYNYRIIRPVDLIKDFNIHKKLLNFETFKQIETEEYKKFLVELYKWCVGLNIEKPIEDLIQKQTNKYYNN